MSEIHEHLRALQRTNYFARRLYLGGAAFMAVLLVIFLVTGAGNPWFPLGAMAFFGGLAAYNERMIRRLRREGYG